MPFPSPVSELDRFRALVLSDGRVQDDLQTHDDIAAFSARASELAAAHGIALTADAIQSGLRSDPIGISRWSAIPLRAAPPETDWLPIHLARFDGQFCIDWAYFGARRLAEPFFENSVRGALMHPLNQLVKCRTRLSDLPAWMQQHPGVEPSGFIFHMSRCGSTLVAQMLASDPRNVVIAEADPLDKAVQIDLARSTAVADPALLRAMIGALGRVRAGSRRYFIKLDSWHTLALPLFRRAFPSVPWVFLYRDPVEVLASQMLQPGLHEMPDFMQADLFGSKPKDSAFEARDCARMLAKICEAVLQPGADGGGLLVNYSELPQALWTRILPHFAIRDADRAAMATAAKYDAKAPDVEFSSHPVDDHLKKNRELSRVAAQYLGDVYRQLEMLRLGGRRPRKTARIARGKTA